MVEKIHSYLIWMDLEMTGLDSKSDRILEIATVITDAYLKIIAVGPEIAIFQDEAVLQKMNLWSQEHHFQSGLIDRVRNSKVSQKAAEKQTLNFVKQYVKKGEAPLCGNSIHQDRNFLQKYMPNLNNYLHYRNIDVSSIKELSYRWYPHLPKFEKKSKHTALEDVYESIAELDYYKKQIFLSE